MPICGKASYILANQLASCIIKYQLFIHKYNLEEESTNFKFLPNINLLSTNTTQKGQAQTLSLFHSPKQHIGVQSSIIFTFQSLGISHQKLYITLYLITIKNNCILLNCIQYLCEGYFQFLLLNFNVFSVQQNVRQ